LCVWLPFVTPLVYCVSPVGIELCGSRLWHPLCTVWLPFVAPLVYCSTKYPTYIINSKQQCRHGPTALGSNVRWSTDFSVLQSPMISQHCKVQWFLSTAKSNESSVLQSPKISQYCKVQWFLSTAKSLWVRKRLEGTKRWLRVTPSVLHAPLFLKIYS